MEPEPRTEAPVAAPEPASTFKTFYVTIAIILGVWGAAWLAGGIPWPALVSVAMFLGLAWWHHPVPVATLVGAAWGFGLAFPIAASITIDRYPSAAVRISAITAAVAAVLVGAIAGVTAARIQRRRSA